MEKKISISQIKEVAQQAYNEVKGQTGGKNADYIPYLANIDSKLFGLSICLMNGQRYIPPYLSCASTVRRKCWI